jgi:hypothetical protein
MFFRHCVFDDHIRWWKILDREIHVWGDVINCEKEAFFYVMKIIPPTVWAPPRLPTNHFCIRSPKEKVNPVASVTLVLSRVPVVRQIIESWFSPIQSLSEFRADCAYARECKYRPSKLARHGKNGNLNKERNGQNLRRPRSLIGLAAQEPVP